MRFLITLALDQKEIMPFEILRKRFDPASSSRIQAHITLVPPFEARGIGQWVACVEKAMPFYRNFSLLNAGTGRFGRRVFYVSFKSPRCLFDLYRDVLDCVNQFIRKQPAYVPHLTIIQRGNIGLINTISRSLPLEGLPLRLRVFGVLVWVWSEEKKKWEVWKKFRFSSSREEFDV